MTLKRYMQVGRLAFALAILAALFVWTPEAFGQTPTATDTPVPTATATPTNTATNTSTPTFTYTSTPTRTPTVQGANTLDKRARPLTKARINALIGHSPGNAQSGLDEIVERALRGVRVMGTNATNLGLTDVGTVIEVSCYVLSSQAACTKAILLEGVDFTVSNHDIILGADQRLNLLVVKYLP